MKLVEICLLRRYFRGVIKANTHIEKNEAAKTWLKRLGFWGFMFFFVKGLLWLIVPALIAYFSIG